MRKISYCIDTYNANQQGGGPVFRLVVGSKKMSYFLIPSALEYSYSHSGIYPILNCSCGVVGCGGAYVKVEHKKGKIIWRKLLSGASCGEEDKEERGFPLKALDKSEINPPITFSGKDYSAVIKGIMSAPEFEKYEKAGYLKDIENFKATDFFIP